MELFPDQWQRSLMMQQTHTVDRMQVRAELAMHVCLHVYYMFLDVHKACVAALSFCLSLSATQANQAL